MNKSIGGIKNRNKYKRELILNIIKGSSVDLSEIPRNAIAASDDDEIVRHLIKKRKVNIAKIVTKLDDYWYIKAFLTDYLIIDERFSGIIDKSIAKKYKKIFIINYGDSALFDGLALDKFCSLENIVLISC